MSFDDYEYFFDPEDIRIESRSLSINYLLDLIQKNEINLVTEFNRRSIWSRKQKSLLIESLILRIPIPSFYFYEDMNWQLHVIDGVQRLITIYEYINGDFRLNALNILDNCNGMTFKDLPQKYKYRILQTQLQINVIDSRTPKEIQFEVLRRLNSGSRSLTPQELRNSVANKYTRELLDVIANDKLFQEILRTKNDRFQLQEYALKFISFFRAYNPESKDVMFNSGSMGDFLDRHFYEINQDSSLLYQYEQIFKKSIHILYDLLLEIDFSKSLKLNKNFIIALLVILANTDNLYKINLNRLEFLILNFNDLEKKMLRQSTREHKVLGYFYMINYILLGDI